jgi:repressor LexA
MMKIGAKLYNRRKELNMTLEDVAKIVGVSKSTVRKWETGYIANMKSDKISLLAKALQVPAGFIMGFDDKTLPPDESVLPEDFKPLLNKFRKLTKKGQEEMLSYLEYLVNKERQDNQ